MQEKTLPFKFEKIAETLSKIEKEVLDLNKCSSDDFQMLNKYLKNQYSRIEKISDNVKFVFELKAGVESLEISKSINVFSSNFTDHVRCFDEKFSNSTEIIEQIISYINLMYIPLKNYLQNIVTLNFLSNSIKFNLVYQKNVKNDLINDEIGQFQEYINQLKNLNNSFDDSSNKIKNDYDTILTKHRSLQENIIRNTEKVEERISIILKRLSDKFEVGKNKIPELNRKKKRYSENVNKIIINLQYSDIIRQKIEHISEAHHDMITKINKLKQNGNGEVVKNYLLQIKDIADLQIAQLIRTNNEYQNAVKIISEKFVEIGRDINDLANETLLLSNLKSINIDKFHDFYDIENQILEIKEIIQIFRDENTLIDIEFQAIIDEFEIYKKHFNAFNNITENINSIVKSVTDKINISFDNKEKINDILSQFNNVVNSLSSNKQDIEKYYNLSNKKQSEIKIGSNAGECPGFKKLEAQINDTFEKTNLNNRTIKEIVIETDKLEKTVTKEINNAVKEIKYYVFYETAATNIIQNLRELYEYINIEHSSEIQKAENLEKHKLKYTMRSERDIHENIVAGKTPELEENEDEVEFF